MTEMHRVVIEWRVFSGRDQRSFRSRRIAISQRAKNPAVGNLVDRARIIVPKGLDHLMHGASIGLPGRSRSARNILS